MLPIIQSIVSQHAEEASFLWLLRNNAVHAPHYALKDLAELDDRIEAHLDGLRTVGDAGEVFAAAVPAFESGEQSRINEVLAVGCQSVELSRGLIWALGWIPFAQASPRIQRLLTAEPSVQRRTGIAASAVHRQDPGGALQDSLSSADPLLKARSLKTVGELGQKNLLPFVTANLAGDDPAAASGLPGPALCLVSLPPFRSSSVSPSRVGDGPK